MSPQRIQRRRTAGWRMPGGAVYVGRPTRWGNPFRVVRLPGGGPFEVRYSLGPGDDTSCAAHEQLTTALAHAVELLGATLRLGHLLLTQAEVRTDLVGCDLACWCPLDQPCHADVLLSIANPEMDGDR